MSEPRNLNFERAQRNGDSAGLEAGDALAEVMRRLRDGETTADGMVILWFEPKASGDGVEVHSMRSKLTYDREIALFEVAKMAALHDWSS